MFSGVFLRILVTDIRTRVFATFHLDIAWQSEGGDPIQLLAPIERKRGFKQAIYTRYGPLCVLSGSATGLQLLAPLAQLPFGCRPRKRLSFLRIVSPGVTFRMDVSILHCV